jgi:hypothetical protein
MMARYPDRYELVDTGGAGHIITEPCRFVLKCPPERPG